MTTAAAPIETGIPAKCSQCGHEGDIKIQPAPFIVERINALVASVGLTFAAFSSANRLRCERDFKRQLGTRDALVSMVIGIGEESGEVLGAVRAYLGINERKWSSSEAVADECADLVSYVDLALQSIGQSLSEALVRKFNRVSERIGSDIRIGGAP